MSTKIPTIEAGSIEDYYILISAGVLLGALQRIQEITEVSPQTGEIAAIQKIARMAIRASGFDGKKEN